MQYEIKAPRGMSSDDRCSKMILTAQNEYDQIKLSIVAWALAEKQDDAFNRWLGDRLQEYAKKHNVQVVSP